MPAMVIAATGFGAGTADLGDRPNLTRVVIGARADAAGRVPGQPVVLLEANVDDVTGEALAYAIEALLDAGAHDAWVTPDRDEEGPPRPHRQRRSPTRRWPPTLRAVLVRETGTHGRAGPDPRALAAEPLVRRGHRRRPRRRVKVAGGRVKAEHDDAARAARALGLPLREVTARAEAAWRTLHP